jgi:hypothetical protein
LNRKGKVEEIRYKVDEAIMRSMYEVQKTRSPERNCRTQGAPAQEPNTFSPEVRNGNAMTTPFRGQGGYY